MKITKENLDSENFYKEFSLNLSCEIEFEENLGCVKFRGPLISKKFIFAKAGEGIEAGLKISAKFIFTPLRIFAGICSWKIPSEPETEIKVQEILKGTVAFGKLKIVQHEKFA